MPQTTVISNNMLSIQLDGALWETLRNVPVDSQGEHTYSLRPRINDVQHRIVFEVKLVDSVKVVTMRSAMVIENRTLLPIDIAILDSTGHRLDGPVRKIGMSTCCNAVLHWQLNFFFLVTLAPGEDFALPIEKAYHNRFSVRPDGECLSLNCKLR